MELHTTLVCVMCRVLRSDSEVLAEFAENCHSEVGNDLAVAVIKYRPSVVCSPQPFTRDATVLKACQTILDQMNTSKDMEIFANQHIHKRDSDIAIPFYYTSIAEGSTNPLYDSPNPAS